MDDLYPDIQRLVVQVANDNLTFWNDRTPLPAERWGPVRSPLPLTNGRLLRCHWDEELEHLLEQTLSQWCSCGIPFEVAQCKLNALSNAAHSLDYWSGDLDDAKTQQHEKLQTINSALLVVQKYARIASRIAATKGTAQDKDPVDDAENYVPAKSCRNDRIRTHKQLTAMLKKAPPNEKGIRRRYQGQHLYIHAADWLRWNAELDREVDRAQERTAAQIEDQIDQLDHRRGDRDGLRRFAARGGRSEPSIRSGKK